MNDKKSLIEFYKKAKQICIDNGYGHEIRYVEERHFKDIDVETFFKEYAFVVLSSGISNKAAESMYKKLMKTQKMSSVKHPGKRKALEKADREYLQWFDLLTRCKYDETRIRFIQTLPYMGPATSYHLARNLGIDCAKPDRHLKRIAWIFRYVEHIGCDPIFKVQNMCSTISKDIGDRIGTVDVILWRYSLLHPEIIVQLMEKVLVGRMKASETIYILKNRIGYSLNEVLKKPSSENAIIVKYVGGIIERYIEYNFLTEKYYKPIKLLNFFEKGKGNI